MRLEVGEERVIVQGIRPEEKLWGPYQFPCPHDLGDRIVVSVHVEEDSINNYGAPLKWFESFDRGKTWSEADPDIAKRSGVLLPGGDRIIFPQESAVSLEGYKIPDFSMLTPGVDFSKQAKEGELPIQDGVTAWFTGTVIRAYLAERLPPSLAKKEWHAYRLIAGESEPVYETIPVEWNCLTRVVHQNKGSVPVMKAMFPRGVPKVGPDGAVWMTAYSGEGHIDPETGRYSPYYSAELFRSEDNCKSFQQVAHMEYRADGNRFPYQSGGFSDSDIGFMPDGSIVWFLRSAWMASTGYEWAPMYYSRSTDMGKTFSEPCEFAPVGVLPRLCSLDVGATLVCFARPGIFISLCEDGKGIEWSEPVEIMTPGDRSALANVKIDDPSFHEWDGAGNNPELLAVSEDTALLFYSDFYYPDPEGVKRKSVLCREIKVLKD